MPDLFDNTALLNKRTEALRRIAAWKGYATFEGELENAYERGVNDILSVLVKLAEEGLGMTMAESDAEELARLKQEEAEAIEQEYADATEEYGSRAYDPA